MERAEVFEIINSEREFQDGFVNEKGFCTKHPVSAELLMMDEYITRAKTAWTNGKGDNDALKEMRKAVAIGIRCFENNGCPKR